MRQIIRPWFVLASLLVAACGEPNGAPTALRPSPATAQRATTSSLTIPVTTIVYDADAAGNPLITRSDDYNGTGSATYAALPSVRSTKNITSVVHSDGGWQLYLGNQTSRTLYLVLASQGIPAPDGQYSASVEAYSQCFDQNDLPVGILVMTAGASNTNCSFGVDFSYGATKYKLVMSPKFPGTGRATVTCNAAANGSCTNWTIVPSDAVDNAGVANLYHYGKNGSLVFDGIYHNSVAINAAQ